MSQVLFSIVCPTYNRWPLLQEAIASARAQTRQDWELLVVDDGSDDGTRERVSAIDPRIRLFVCQRGGPARARNVAWPEARGELVAFLDSDDRWSPEHLSEAGDLFERHPEVDFAFGDARFVGRSGTRSSYLRGKALEAVPFEPDGEWRIFRRSIYPELVLEPAVATSSVVIRRSALERAGGFDERWTPFGEDNDLWLRVSARSRSAAKWSASVERRKLGDNLVNAAKEELRFSLHIEVLEEHARTWGGEFRKQIRRRLAELYALRGRARLRAGRVAVGLVDLGRAASLRSTRSGPGIRPTAVEDQAAFVKTNSRTDTMLLQTVPAIPELRQRVEKSEEKYGPIPWISKKIIHPHVSIYFTSLFLRLGLTGDQVTYVMLAMALAGPALFFRGGTLGYVGGAVMMLLSWVVDHSDGEVRRFRGEDSNLGVYLDRFTHRVSYPLMHLGMGFSLWRSTGRVGFLLFGAAVAYFYQLGVAHQLDKTLIQIQRGGLDMSPLRTLRRRATERFPRLDLPLKLAVGGYSQLIQNNSFFVLLILAAFSGLVVPFYLAYGSVLIANWFLSTLLDFGVAFRSAGAEAPEDSSSKLSIEMH